MLRNKDFYWGADAAVNVYISELATTLNAGSGRAAVTWTMQLTKQRVSAYGNPFTPISTYKFSYVTDPNYVSLGNRLAQATVTTSAVTFTLAANSYDGTNMGNL